MDNKIESNNLPPYTGELLEELHRLFQVRRGDLEVVPVIQSTELGPPQITGIEFHLRRRLLDPDSNLPTIVEEDSPDLDPRGVIRYFKNGREEGSWVVPIGTKGNVVWESKADIGEVVEHLRTSVSTADLLNEAGYPVSPAVTAGIFPWWKIVPSGGKSGKYNV